MEKKTEDGPSFIARCLKHAVNFMTFKNFQKFKIKNKNIKNISFVFGIVGIPVTPISVELQKQGIPFYGMRNEQAASYATSAVGFLTQNPAVCLTVAGPGSNLFIF